MISEEEWKELSDKQRYMMTAKAYAKSVENDKRISKLEGIIEVLKECNNIS